MTAMEEDPFDTLLSLEDGFYKEGYDLGVSDGARAGLIEGRQFGLEKGFEKYTAMGKLHGRAMIWAGRLPGTRSHVDVINKEATEVNLAEALDSVAIQDYDAKLYRPIEQHAPPLPANPRLETHVRTLYALSEPGSLSTDNNEDAVSDFDDRLKRAEGKVKVVKKLIGESNYGNKAQKNVSHTDGILRGDPSTKKGDGSIEDTSILNARH